MIPNERQAGGQAGMGLVELMVAMVIGLFTVLVIMQVFSVFEGDKRTTTSGADAQTNGMIALYSIKRQVAMAGFGLPTISEKTPPLQLCKNLCFDSLNGESRSCDLPPPPLVNLTPVSIIDGGVGASDTIIIRYATSQPVGAQALGGTQVYAVNTANSNDVEVKNAIACQDGDVALVATALNQICRLAKVSTVDPLPLPLPLPVPLPVPLPKPLPNSHIKFEASFPHVGGSTSIACMGRWTELSYRVDNEHLVEVRTVNGVTDPNPLPNPLPSMVEDIVNIQAQYGISGDPNNNIIINWVDAPFAARNQIKAIRMAVVARSGLKEKIPVVQDCCTWTGGTINIANLPGPDPEYYRYKVFETVIPLRNVVWTKGKL